MRSRTRSRVRGKLPVFAVLALGMACVVGVGCSSEPEPVTVSYSPFEPTALVWIAQDQGFFANKGLEVTFQQYDTGPAAVEAMITGEADIAVGIGEFPMTAKVLQAAPVRILASMDRSELISIVARRDRGITEPVDLRGKTVGTTKGTMAEFFLGRFLQVRGLSIDDITVVDLDKPSEWVDAVLSGEVDAVATAQPYSAMAADRLGENAVVWSAHDGQLMYALAVTDAEWLETHQQGAVKFLRALAQAEEFAARSPAQAQAIVQKALALDPSSMEAVWQRNQFYLTLDQSLVMAMEDEARWLMAEGLAEGSLVPDFTEWIWREGMDRARPEAVDLISTSEQ